MAFRIPCFTLGENTEKSITMHLGTNVLVDASKKKIMKEYRKFKNELIKREISSCLFNTKTA